MTWLRNLLAGKKAARPPGRVRLELEALEGADKTIKSSRPILLIEKIKTNAEQLHGWLAERGYVLREVGINLLAIHSDDKTLAELNPAKKAP